MNSLEVANSASGHQVLKWNGRHLCSKQDPVREAQHWVEAQNHLLQGARVAIVLGVGGGFHLAELRACHPRIQLLALESRPDIVEQHGQISPPIFSGIEIVKAADLEALQASALIRTAVKQHYAVLMHPSTQVTDKEFYREARDLLLGRTLKGLRFVLEQRPELRACFNLEALFQQGLNKSYLSIKDLDTLISPTATPSRALALHHILRELIK